MTPEEELWDDKGKQTKPIKHAKCGGRVYWIKGEEHRCIKCLKAVDADEMLFEEELRVR